mmetsp:Transcript_84725/g.137377  ORF Transcript_84725/g.137377 Transcript_84725/m.137377 type:complete len:236 (-) Transcript_84725:924-1631(-)
MVSSLSPAISPGHSGFLLKSKSFTRAGGFVFEYSLLSTCSNDNEDGVISCTGMLDDSSCPLLIFSIDGIGQLLISLESTSSRTVQVPINKTARRRYLRVRTRVAQQSMAKAFCTLLFHLTVPLLDPFSLSGTWTHILSSCIPALMMALFSLLTSPSVFLPLLPSGAQTLSPRARVRLQTLLLHPSLARHTRTMGCIPFPSLHSPISSFLHLLLIGDLPIPFPLLPSLPALLFWSS